MANTSDDMTQGMHNKIPNKKEKMRRAELLAFFKQPAKNTFRSGSEIVSNKAQALQVKIEQHPDYQIFKNYDACADQPFDVFAYCYDLVCQGGPVPVKETSETDMDTSRISILKNIVDKLKLRLDFWDRSNPYDPKRNYTVLKESVVLTKPVVVQSSVPDVTEPGANKEPQPQPQSMHIQFRTTVLRQDDEKQRKERAQILLNKIKNHADFGKFEKRLKSASTTTDEGLFSLEDFCNAIIASGGPLMVARHVGGMEGTLYDIIDNLNLDNSFWDINSDWQDPDKKPRRKSIMAAE